MKRKSVLGIFAAIIMFCSGCASIVSKSTYPVNINTIPSQAEITITNRKDITVFSGTSPATVYLKSGGGFFKRGIYRVRISKEGYQPAEDAIVAEFDGWYIGNIVFGGVIGFLIVDPATGAMYKINKPYINVTLIEQISKTDDHQPQLHILDISDIPEEWEQYLVQVETL